VIFWIILEIARLKGLTPCPLLCAPRQAAGDRESVTMARGWRGDPPRNDEEARQRIIEAAMRCIDRHGPHKTGLSDVASELGVTRQTVYRLYESTDELLLAVGAAAADDYLDRLAAHVADLPEPGDAIVEGIAYTFERLPHEPFLGLLLTTGRSEAFLKGVTSPRALAFGRSMLARMSVDWAAAGYDADELDGLVEFGLRVLQSLVLDPPRQRRGARLRAYLTRWVAPAVRAASAPAAGA
jgi:AcrR family transcriptional regulator